MDIEDTFQEHDASYPCPKKSVILRQRGVQHLYVLHGVGKPANLSCGRRSFHDNRIAPYWVDSLVSSEIHFLLL